MPTCIKVVKMKINVVMKVVFIDASSLVLCESRVYVLVMQYR